MTGTMNGHGYVFCAFSTFSICYNVPELNENPSRLDMKLWH